MLHGCSRAHALWGPWDLGGTEAAGPSCFLPLSMNMQSPTALKTAGGLVLPHI